MVDFNKILDLFGTEGGWGWGNSLEKWSPMLGWKKLGEPITRAKSQLPEEK